MNDIIGRTFNGYQVIEQIGSGGMATVYKAISHHWIVMSR